ncbi:MAG: hypothetical protein U5K56_13520 [Halioglobus sp.]|nr:hypothetical protein [Halioglobus sp.]
MLKRPGRRGQPGQFSLEQAAALHQRAGPDQLLHRLLRAHPGAAGQTPAGGGEDAEFQTEPVRVPRRRAQCLAPFGRHIVHAALLEQRRFQADVRGEQAADTRPGHPVQVRFDTLFGDVPVHPVPPDTRLRDRRRRLETALQRVRRPLAGREAPECPADPQRTGKRSQSAAAPPAQRRHHRLNNRRLKINFRKRTNVAVVWYFF